MVDALHIVPPGGITLVVLGSPSGWRGRGLVVSHGNALPSGSVGTRDSRGTSAPTQEVVRVDRDHVKRPAFFIALRREVRIFHPL